MSSPAQLDRVSANLPGLDIAIVSELHGLRPLRLEVDEGAAVGFERTLRGKQVAIRIQLGYIKRLERVLSLRITSGLVVDRADRLIAPLEDMIRNTHKDDVLPRVDLFHARGNIRQSNGSGHFSKPVWKIPSFFKRALNELLLRLSNTLKMEGKTL